MNDSFAELYEIASLWEQASRTGTRDEFSYERLLDEIVFHAKLRFIEYRQFREEGPFAVRLLKWISQVDEDRQRKTLLLMLRHLLFIDHWQMRSLYRDAYRRIIVPWILEKKLSAADQLSPDYEIMVRSTLRAYRFFSITESFVFNEFIHENSLAGLPKPTTLGEDDEKVGLLLPSSNSALPGLIVFEDFVGSGRQAGKILMKIKENAAPDWRILFVPLIILKRGVRNVVPLLKDSQIRIEPVWTVPDSSCILEQPADKEPGEFTRMRTLINRTRKRVLERLGETDDPPTDPFGYKGSGAMLVTSHNTPNNAPPLIHHRAPEWNPLFRRVHHSKDGL